MTIGSVARRAFTSRRDPVEAALRPERLAVPRRPGGSLWRLLRSAGIIAWVGLGLIGIYLIVAVFAPVLAPFGESEIVGDAYQPWDETFLLGTDHLGRDMLSRMIYAARNTIGIALVTTVLSFVTGGALGLVAAGLGGRVDQALSRIVDALMAIPHLIFTLVLLSIFGSSVPSLVVIIAGLDATRIFRLTRAVARNVVVLEFVQVAHLQGESLGSIMARDVLPNITAPLIAEFGLRFSFVFLTISALSFLGVGLQPPTADWGSMVRENAALITFRDVTPLLPAGAIALLAVAVNLVVDWFLHISSGLKHER